jgi:hypothetical protein
MIPVGLKFHNFEADFLWKLNRPMRLSIDQDEGYFAADTINGVGALQDNAQID